MMLCLFIIHTRFCCSQLSFRLFEPTPHVLFIIGNLVMHPLQMALPNFSASLVANWMHAKLHHIQGFLHPFVSYACFTVWIKWDMSGHANHKLLWYKSVDFLDANCILMYYFSFCMVVSLCCLPYSAKQPPLLSPLLNSLLSPSSLFLCCLLCLTPVQNSYLLNTMFLQMILLHQKSIVCFMPLS